MVGLELAAREARREGIRRAGAGVRDPVVRVGGTLEGLGHVHQVVDGGWVGAGVRESGLGGGFDRLEVRVAGGRLALVLDRVDRQYDDARENAEDNDHDEEFDQGEALLVPPRGAHALLHGLKHELSLWDGGCFRWPRRLRPDTACAGRITTIAKRPP